jgi:hypothetical protein
MGLVAPRQDAKRGELLQRQWANSSVRRSSLFEEVWMGPRLQARQPPPECHTDTDMFLQFCRLSHFNRLWCSAAMQYALLIASTTRVTRTPMCGMGTKFSTTNARRSKPTATIESSKSSIPMSRRIIRVSVIWRGWNEDRPSSATL